MDVDIVKTLTSLLASYSRDESSQDYSCKHIVNIVTVKVTKKVDV